MIGNLQATSQSWKKKKKALHFPIGPILIFQVHKVRMSAREKTIGPNFNAHESADCSSTRLLRKARSRLQSLPVLSSGLQCARLPPGPESGPVFGIRQEIVAWRNSTVASERAYGPSRVPATENYNIYIDPSASCISHSLNVEFINYIFMCLISSLIVN